MQNVPQNEAGAPDERLERGAILTFRPCPFALPQADDLAFLMEQRLKSSIHKNISYNPEDDSISGHGSSAPEQSERMRRLMRSFADSSAAWLTELLPRYAQRWQRDRASFRPEEEAVRKLRMNARNDLLHLDAFPSRPTRGWRILRLFVNVHPMDDRVWVTSETFARLLDRYARKLGLPDLESAGWASRIGQGLLSLFHPGVAERTAYDRFMLKLHDFLKTNDEFQERASRRFWHFAPGTAWVVFTDAVSHAELRGQYALEHSFFVAPETLALPHESPPAILASVCRQRARSDAA